MTTLQWQPEFALQQPRMDHTHLEFIDRLSAVETAAPGTATDAALRALLLHTEAHFDQEERWMSALGFASENCHSMQHSSVLQVLGEVVRRHGQAADTALVRNLVAALAEWFPVHATMMDAALAMTMAERGFDPAADASAPPRAAVSPAMTGCGSPGCGGT